MFDMGGKMVLRNELNSETSDSLDLITCESQARSTRRHNRAGHTRGMKFESLCTASCFTQQAASDAQAGRSRTYFRQPCYDEPTCVAKQSLVLDPCNPATMATKLGTAAPGNNHLKRRCNTCASLAILLWQHGDMQLGGEAIVRPGMKPGLSQRAQTLHFGHVWLC